MATEIITANARKNVVPRRIRADRQPPIAAVARNTTGAIVTLVVGLGATSLEITKSTPSCKIAIAT